jgi:hypothetical protein
MDVLIYCIYTVAYLDKSLLYTNKNMVGLLAGNGTTSGTCHGEKNIFLSG